MRITTTQIHDETMMVVETPSLRWIYKQHILEVAIMRPFYSNFKQKPAKEQQRLIEQSQIAFENRDLEIFP